LCPETGVALAAAMTERLRPGGDSAALVYSAQKLVEMRFSTMKIDAVQAATKLFEDVCMEMYHDLARQGAPGGGMRAERGRGVDRSQLAVAPWPSGCRPGGGGTVGTK